jgi:hypothetical protein
VGISRLAKSVVMSKRKLQETIIYLEGRGLLKRLRSIMGGPSKGNVYRVFVPSETIARGATVAGDAAVAPHASMAPHATVAPRANNKYDDDIKIKSSSKGEKAGVDNRPVENHSGAAAPREIKETADDDLSRVRAAYEKATGNRWNKSDSEAYHQHGIARIPTEKPSRCWRPSPGARQHESIASSISFGRLLPRRISATAPGIKTGSGKS